MNSNHFKIYGPIAILLIAVALSALMIMARPEARQQATVPVKPLVDIVQVAKQTVSIPVEVQGNVRAHTQTRLIADVSGRVVWVAEHFKAGAYIKKGKTLARIDDRPYVAALKRAEAGLAGARSALASEQGRADVALKEWQQRAKNIKRSEAATELYLRKPQLAEARARLESAEADLIQAQADLEHTRVRAPYDAMIREKNIDLGQSLSPGTQIGAVFAIDRVEVKVPLPEKDLQFIDIPSAHSLTRAMEEASQEQFKPRVVLRGSGSQAARQWQGRLVRTEGVLDEKTRSMIAVIEVDDPYGLLGNTAHQASPLRVGSYVSARIDGKPMPDLIALSQAAVMPGNKVWRVNEHDRLEQATVGILVRTEDMAYISSGLEDQDRVSLTTLSSFSSGAQVRIASVNGKAAEDSLRLESSTVTAGQADQP